MSNTCSVYKTDLPSFLYLSPPCSLQLATFSLKVGKINLVNLCHDTANSLVTGHKIIFHISFFFSPPWPSNESYLVLPHNVSGTRPFFSILAISLTSSSLLNLVHCNIYVTGFLISISLYLKYIWQQHKRLHFQK